MAKLTPKAATTSKTIKVFMTTNGVPITGLTSASTGLSAAYIIEGQSAFSTFALSGGTVGTWSSGGFKEVDSAKAPGLYEVGIPNAGIASGKSSIISVYGFAGQDVCLSEIELTAVDNQDSAAYGLTAMPMSLTQAVPTSNTAQTVGDALNAARADGFGKWTLSGTTLTIYAGDGTTAVRTFTLDSSTAPTSRT